MTPQEFLVWLTTAAGYSVAFSFVAERIAWFQTLTPGQKQLANLLGPLVIALGAYAVLTYVPPETLEAIRPIFLLISTVVGSWVANQVGHKLDPRA